MTIMQLTCKKSMPFRELIDYLNITTIPTFDFTLYNTIGSFDNIRCDWRLLITQIYRQQRQTLDWQTNVFTEVA